MMDNMVDVVIIKWSLKMNNFNGGNSTSNHGNEEFCHPSNQSSNSCSQTEALQKELVDEYEMKKKLKMDYKRASKYNDDMIQQLDMELENCERQVEEEEKACAASKKEIEEMRNEMLVLQETYEKYVEKNDELDADILGAHKERENYIIELISAEDQLWEAIVKASGIDRPWDELWFENNELERFIATGENLIGEIMSLCLENEETMAQGGDSSNSPTVVKSCEGMSQELDEMKISDHEASL